MRTIILHQLHWWHIQALTYCKRLEERTVLNALHAWRQGGSSVGHAHTHVAYPQRRVLTSSGELADDDGCLV